jgi:hypothetical protein
MVLVVGRVGLGIKQGTISAPLDLGTPVTGLGQVTVDAKRRTVTIVHECNYCCASDRDRTTLELDALRARLVNARAMREHRRKRYAAAAAGFARAAGLDPAFRVARTNWACALARQGKLAEAIAVLRPLLAKDPFEVYHRVLADSDLRGLVGRPEISALRSKRPGTARLALARRHLAALSPTHRLVAVTVPYASWGTEQWALSLQVLSLRSGERVLKLPLAQTIDMTEGGSFSRSGRAAAKKRLALANRLLRDLGFVVPRSVERRELTLTGGKLKGRFPRARLALVVSPAGVARLVRGDRVLGKVAVGTTIIGAMAYHLPTTRAVVFSWAIDEPEGCGLPDDAITGAALVPYQTGESPRTP